MPITPAALSFSRCFPPSASLPAPGSCVSVRIIMGAGTPARAAVWPAGTPPIATSSLCVAAFGSASRVA
eukprot:6717096-Prymnesium_polylepis.1